MWNILKRIIPKSKKLNSQQNSMKPSYKLVKALEEQYSSPGEFIKCIMHIEGMSMAELARRLGTTEPYVALTVMNRSVPSIKAVVKFADVLGIDPYLLNRICSDYKLKTYLEKNKDGQTYNS